MRALWTAATGMQAQQLTLDVVANNLANVQTAGFKRSRVDFQDLVYETLQAPGAASAQGQEIPTGFQVGHGSRAVATQRLFIKGDLQQTGNALDLAIEGDGFFQVQQPTGETAYSRSGAFKKDSQGTGGHLRWICHRTANHHTGQRAQYYRRRRRDCLGLVARPDPTAAGWHDRNRAFHQSRRLGCARAQSVSPEPSFGRCHAGNSRPGRFGNFTPRLRRRIERQRGRRNDRLDHQPTGLRDQFQSDSHSR